MPITEQQRKDRITFIGSSEMAMLLKVDRWQRNAYDLWLVKTDKVTEAESKIWMEAGNVLEPGVLKWAEGELGPIRTEENGEALFRKSIAFPLGSHPDGEAVLRSDNPVEAKTAGIFGPIIGDWGEPGTDELPEYILVQCHVHMECCNKQVCYVPVLLSGKGFVLYTVHQDQVIADAIRETSLDFWENFVEKDIPPPDVMPSLPFAKRMKRKPKKTVKIDNALVVNWQTAKETLRMAKGIKEGAEAEMLAALGDAEGGECDLGLIAYLEQSKSYITAKELKVANPELYAKLERVTTYRVARLKKPKKLKF